MSLFEVCQEIGVNKGEIWRTFRVPEWNHGGQGYPLSWIMIFYSKDDALKDLG